jgi:putative FmdB family regulatory protein
MPFYDYKCAFGHTTERFLSINDAPKTIDCPRCKALANLQFSPPAFHLKGGGVARTVNPK